MIPESPGWRQISEIFDLVADAAPGRRGDLLDRLCVGDAGLRRKVEALLRADAAAARFDRHVESACASALRDWSDEAEAEATVPRIGAWRVVSELGRGGMGVVLLVERADGQYEQRAALKLIKRGMDSEAILARFLRERQILAQLEHPHIARLLDGGIAADGRPYFAMEYVAGEPLLDYCQARRADLAARIELFLQICSAVQFAHGQLVVHRDIKPSNLLVTAQGQAKLLDFGIAKLIQPGAEDTGTAPWHDRPLTLAYAAPEQLRGDAATVATDIYGLGGVLYELLTGCRAHDIGDAVTLDELRKVLEADAPRAPSQTVRADSPISARQLRGDLDTIVLQSLRRQPERRYATVEALAADLRRFQRGFPISARREQTSYRVRKFAARHRYGLAAALLATAALVVTTAFSVREAQVARREAVRADAEASTAQAEKDFLLATFNKTNPYYTDGEVLSARGLIERVADDIDAAFSANPRVRAELHESIGSTFYMYTETDRALKHYTAALAAYRNYLPEDAGQVLDAQIEVAWAEYYKSDLAGVVKQLAHVLEVCPRSARCVGTRSAALLQQSFAFRDGGDYARALAANERALAEIIQNKDAQTSSYDISYAKYSLARLLTDTGRIDAALPQYRDFVASDVARVKPGHPGLVSDAQQIGNLMAALGRLNEAHALLQRVMALRRRMFGERQVYFLRAAVRDGEVLALLGDGVQARESLDKALRVYRSIGADFVELPAAEYENARARWALGDLDAADSAFAAARNDLENLGGTAHPLALASRAALAEIALVRKQPRAETELRKLADVQRQHDAAELPRTLLALARAAHARADESSARALVSETLAALARQGRPWHPIAGEAYLLRADCAAAEHDAAAARTARVHALASAVFAFGEAHAHTRDVLAPLAANDAAGRENALREARELLGPPAADDLYQAALDILARAEAASAQAQG